IENRSVPVLLNVSAMRPLTANRWFITENYLVVPWQRTTRNELDPTVQLASRTKQSAKGESIRVM
ncbi:hypothetical protein N9E17_01080, partial [bacterium]|nr:hypothetical protein [bacterium]